MTDKEYIQKYMNGEPKRIAIMYALAVIQARVKKEFNGQRSVQKRINPYNPLSYIIITIILIATGIGSFVKAIPEIIDEFKY